MTDWQLQAGDWVTMDVTVKRRWWQVWRPRRQVVQRQFIVSDPITAREFGPAVVLHDQRAP
jgi:hypothetical protein